MVHGQEGPPSNMDVVAQKQVQHRIFEMSGTDAWTDVRCLFAWRLSQGLRHTQAPVQRSNWSQPKGTKGQAGLHLFEPSSPTLSDRERTGCSILHRKVDSSSPSMTSKEPQYYFQGGKLAEHTAGHRKGRGGVPHANAHTHTHRMPLGPKSNRGDGPNESLAKRWLVDPNSSLVAQLRRRRGQLQEAAQGQSRLPPTATSHTER
jgi:hypothetical protein